MVLAIASTTNIAFVELGTLFAETFVHVFAYEVAPVGAVTVGGLVTGVGTV